MDKIRIFRAPESKIPFFFVVYTEIPFFQQQCQFHFFSNSAVRFHHMKQLQNITENSVFSSIKTKFHFFSKCTSDQKTQPFSCPYMAFYTKSKLSHFLISQFKCIRMSIHLITNIHQKEKDRCRPCIFQRQASYL